MLQMLAQEPWCFHPSEIATLTDWQILHLYAEPAIERAKRIEAEMPKSRSTDAATHKPGQAPNPNSPQFKDWVIAQFMAMGMNRAKARQQYEQQARQSKG